MSLSGFNSVGADTTNINDILDIDKERRHAWLDANDPGWRDRRTASAWNPFSAVVEFVKDPARATTNFFNEIGVNPALRAIDQAIVQPIGIAVEDIAKGIEANPVKFIVQVALGSNPTTAWMIPIVEGIDVAAKGGNVEDVLKAAAISYVSQQGGQYVGSKVSGAVGKSLSANDPLGFNFDPTPHIAAAVAGGAASGATVAAITGQDLLKGAVSGGITGGVRSVLNSIDGFADLKKSSPAAANAIQSTVIASLTGRDPSKALINSLISSSELATKAIKAFDPKNGQEGAKMTPTQTALATDILMGTMSAALTGGNASAAVQAALLNAGTKALGDMISSKVFQDDAAKAEAAYKKAEAEAKKAQETKEKYDRGVALANKRNELLQDFTKNNKDPGYVSRMSNEISALDKVIRDDPQFKELEKRATERRSDIFSLREKEVVNRKKLQDLINAEGSEALKNNYRLQADIGSLKDAASHFQAGATLQAEIDAFNKKPTTGAARDALMQKIQQYETNTAFYDNAITGQVKQLDSVVATTNADAKNFEQGLKTYEGTLSNFNKITQSLMNNLEPTFKMVNQLTVEAIDPKFNAEEYVKVNGLTVADPYAHFLQEGQLDRLPTNMKAAEAQIVTQRTKLVNDVLKSQGQTLATADPREVSKILDSVDRYGNNLTALKAATIQDVIRGSTVPKDGTPRVVVTAPTNYGAWNKPPEKEFSVPAGMKLADQVAFKSGTAHQVVTANGNHVWVVPDAATAPKIWNVELGSMTELPTVIVMGSAPKVTEADQLLAYTEKPSVWEDYVSKPALAGAQAIVNQAKATGNSTLINTAANLMKAGGGFLESVGSIAILSGMAPQNNKFTQFAKSLENIGKAGNTAEYQKAISEMDAILEGGKGVAGTLQAIYGAARHAPVEFIAEYLGVEGMQEILPWLIGGGVGAGVKGAASIAGVGKKVADAIGFASKASAGVTLNIAESAGGAAQSAYQDTYNTAIKVGKSESEAHKMAMNVAQQAGVFAGAVTAATMGIGGDVITKALKGRPDSTMAGAWDHLGKFAKEGGKLTVREGVTEAGEEGLTQAFVESQLYKIDPTRDVAGNITQAAAFGAIAGGPIAGAGYAGSKTGEAISSALLANPNIQNTLASATSAADAEAKLKGLGITNRGDIANVLNSKYDSQFTSNAEARAELAKYKDYSIQNEDIINLTGATSNADLADTVNKYVDSQVVDIEEVKAAAAAEGYTLTDAEAAALVGQKTEAPAIAAIKQQYDPLATTVEEARQMVADLGYTGLTDAEAESLAGKIKEADARKNVEAFVNPRQVTEAEARKFFQDQGYKPTDAEVKQFVGQVNQTEQLAKINEYSAAMMVTEQEVRDAYDKLGLKKPTQNDILKLVGQYDQKLLTEKATANLDSARYNSIMQQYDTLSAQQKATVDALAKQGVDLNTAINNVSGQVANLATTIGRPGTQATQQDLDAMISLLESQGVYDPRYDYNGDKKIDQIDKVAVEQALHIKPGQNIDQDFVFTPAAGSMWAPTGLFAAQAAEAEKTRQAQAAEAEKIRQEQARQANLTRQAQQAAALRTQRMGNINTMQNMLMQSPDIAGQQVTVKAPDPAKIGYMYDWSSIFANPAQEKMFVSPYAQGGTVQDVNDELLNILRG